MARLLAKLPKHLFLGIVSLVSTLFLSFGLLQTATIAGIHPQVLMGRPADAVSVYLLAGQSNMAGEASRFRLPPDLTVPYPAVKIWQPEAHGFVDLQPGFAESAGDSDAFGPELSFGRTMDDQRLEPVYLIKHALGATNLAEDWNPDRRNNQHHIFVTKVKTALDFLKRDHVRYIVKGMAWMQGENDAFEAEQFANDYEANLRALIADMRSHYGNHLRFVIGQLSQHLPEGFTYQEQIRSAQRQVAATDPLTSIVKTDQFSLQADQVHFDAQGQLDLGRAFAQAMVE